MVTKNITREQRALLIGRLELIPHAIQPGVVLSEEMAEIIIDTLMDARETIKNHPIQLRRI